MTDITHCHNERPVIEKDGERVHQWEQPCDITGTQPSPDYTTYEPVVFDIETDASLDQEPILLVAYDVFADHLIVLHMVGYDGFQVSESEVQELVPDEIGRITVSGMSASNFVGYVLEPIHAFNTEHDQIQKSLVAHNLPFDIGIMGSPDDGLLDSSRIESDDWEMCAQYSGVSVVGKRAGQFGQIYQFIDCRGQYQPMRIPTGDTMVASQALWLPGSLAGACEAIGVERPVTEAEEHGKLGDDYFRYCVNDVMATVDLYRCLNDRFADMFGGIPVERIYSTASIAKHVLRSMDYDRPGYEQEAVDRIAPAYFGGRTEALRTGEIIDNLRYTDILSQYPTVSGLTDCWRFAKADSVCIEQIDPDDLPTDPDMTDPDSWGEVSDYYVLVDPDGATMPVRTSDIDDANTRVELAQTELDSGQDALMYHYMDVLSADLMDGERRCDIKAAWRVYPEGSQSLESTSVAGVRIEPEDNVMTKCIGARKKLQERFGGKNEQTKALKITANSMYGVSAERIVQDDFETGKHDVASESGYYNPHIAATITAGGRLQIALGEYAANKAGGELYYCDTDSFVVDSEHVDTVIDTFSDLNPYTTEPAASLPVLEDEVGEDISMFQVGVKKYVTWTSDGEPAEYTEHGLGNYDNLRDDETIERLWATVLDLAYAGVVRDDRQPINRERLTTEELQEPVFWSFNCSTRSMRETIDSMLNRELKYGDWVQSTMSTGEDIRYFGLDIMDGVRDTDFVMKVETDDDENVRTVEQVGVDNMYDDDRLKTTRDVVDKFLFSSETSDGRPTVTVTDTKVVTKESDNRIDVFTAKMAEWFRANMSDAIELLDF